MTDETGAGATIDYAEVMRRLPHRYPFLLVDKAEDFVSGTSITGIKNVTHNEPFFPGHFPIDPVMPGVLIVEAMAQTGALLMSKSLDVAVADKVIMFMSIDGVRFRKPARPGDQLRMQVKVIKARAEEGRTMILVTHDMKLAADVSDHVIFLHQGKIEEEGPPETLFGAPKSERLRQFLSASMPS